MAQVQVGRALVRVLLFELGSLARSFFVALVLSVAIISSAIASARQSRRVGTMSVLSFMDAPGLNPDWGRHLLAWSPHGDHLAVGLGTECHVKTLSSDASTLVREGTGQVHALTFLGGGSVACATSTGGLEVWDLESSLLVRDIALPQPARVVSALGKESPMLAVGCAGGLVLQTDVRMPCGAVAQKLRLVPSDAVCGLAWSPDGGQKLAASTARGLCTVWDRASLGAGVWSSLRGHSAAVKSLVWTERRVVATGAGTADGKVRLFDLLGAPRLRRPESDDEGGRPLEVAAVAEYATRGQVSALAFSEEYRELLSCTGYAQVGASDEVCDLVLYDCRRRSPAGGHTLVPRGTSRSTWRLAQHGGGARKLPRHPVLHAAVSPVTGVLAALSSDEIVYLLSCWPGARSVHAGAPTETTPLSAMLPCLR